MKTENNSPFPSLPHGTNSTAAQLDIAEAQLDWWEMQEDQPGKNEAMDEIDGRIDMLRSAIAEYNKKPAHDE